jgi:adenylate kinase
MIITITGTPGTGKTTIAKKLCEKFNFVYIDVNSIIDEFNLKDSFDKKKDCYVVDIKKLEESVFFIIKKSTKTYKKEENYKIFVIDSHMSHFFENKKIDLCVVCLCNLKELKTRLEKRKYSKKKIEENLTAEIFETCLIEAQENRQNILKLKSKNLNYKINKIVKKIDSLKKQKRNKSKNGKNKKKLTRNN